MIFENFKRRDWIKLFYPILSLLSRIYFFAIQLIFELYYINKPKTYVDLEPDPLLLISAKKAAEKIRNQEVLINFYLKMLFR